MRQLRKKKAYVRLTQDYDALDVANRIGIIWSTQLDCSLGGKLQEFDSWSHPGYPRGVDESWQHVT